MPGKHLFLLIMALWFSAGVTVHAGDIHHYIFFNRERERISEASFLETPAIAGAQLKYTWRELDHGDDGYKLDSIRRDLKYLNSRGKKLFIQLQDVSFDPSLVNIPRDMRDNPKYHGGANQQFEVLDTDPQEERPVPAGWVARRWDPEVRQRFQKLLQALGQEFDGQIAGINLPETSVGFGDTGRLYPEGFTPEIYRDAILDTMQALKRAFPKSITLQYANFMPGEWLPDNDHKFLRAIYDSGIQLQVGLGGPDLLPFQRGQWNHSYPLLKSVSGKVPTGIAVQEGNYQHINPKTKERMAVADMARFAREQLGVSYLFWSTQEPWYSNDVIPYLQSLSR
ncbi:MAG: hypothetical protein JSS02_27420 [Planctomycetes bacterium]|nr:hypothetical protein [Planctomycetota bacterium]